MRKAVVDLSGPGWEERNSITTFIDRIKFMTKWPFPLFCLGDYCWNGDTRQLGMVLSFLFFTLFTFLSVCFLSLIKKTMTLLLKVGGYWGDLWWRLLNGPSIQFSCFSFHRLTFPDFSWSSVCPAGIYPSGLLCSLMCHLTVSYFLEEVMCATLRLCPLEETAFPLLGFPSFLQMAIHRWEYWVCFSVKHVIRTML